MLSVGKALQEEVISAIDRLWYLNQYPDVEALGMDPVDHFMRFGARMLRDPSPAFSTSLYLRTYPDVARSGVNPLVHYLTCGQREGRKAFGSSLSGANTKPADLDESVGAPETSIPLDAKSERRQELLRVSVLSEDVKRLHHLAGDLMKKLWGGFSRHAERDLLVLFDSELPKSRKGAIAWELARFYAANGDLEACLNALRMVRRYDKKLLNQKRGRLLEIEACIGVGAFEKARGLVAYPLQNGIEDGDFFCALSNILGAEASDFDDPDSVSRSRLEAINCIFRKHGYVPLCLLDSAKPLSFANISAEKTISDPNSSLAKISVLMPVYGAESYIRAAVQSILNQTWQNLEVILVEDRGPDDSWSIIQELAREDNRIICVQNDVNQGAYATRNRALDLATGDYVTVHDSDDWSHPQMLSVQMEAMIKDPSLKVSFTSMTRVFPNMTFSLRPERNNMEYIHRSYPSLLIRRSDLMELDRWDRIAANADDELVQRARQRWGSGALKDVASDVPFSFFLKHDASLTSQKGTHLRSLTFGVRHEYGKQAKFWRENVYLPLRSRGLPVPMARTSPKLPFPIPANLWPKDWVRNSHYDLILISDLTLLGGTRRCNEGYINAARKLNLRVGLFHWPRYDLRLQDDIAAAYRALSYYEGIDILTVEEAVSCVHLIIHHPPILKYIPDGIPNIETRTLDVLVNQLPRQTLSGEDKYYARDDIEATCRNLFGKMPRWLPISPLVRRFLIESGYTNLSEEDWIPPLGRTLLDTDIALSIRCGDSTPILGRHSRDHWTKWPGNEEELIDAYCGGSEFEVRLMGGTAVPRNLVNVWPQNWKEFEFDSLSVSEFLTGLDFFLHFTHSDYIEEFGRNIMEAMAHGIPVIVPIRFREVFGDAAVYSEPESVAKTVRRIWQDPAEYSDLVRRGLAYVRQNADGRVVETRLLKAVQSASPRVER